MVDIALTENLVAQDLTAATKRISRGDVRFRQLTLAAALLVLAVFVGVMVSLTYGAMPAFKAFGWPFLWTKVWNPVTDKFGLLTLIYGTLVTSLLSMALAVPVGIGIAIFLTELCPRALRRPIGIAVELLAGIPSIIYGIWGLFVFVPFFQSDIEPYLIKFFSNIPVLGTIFAGPPYGIGIFTASLILSVMILPFISAVTRDVFETVPPILKEAAYAVGCTTWEVMWRVVLPYSRAGVVGGAMLALGRALGETMAVTFVIGNSHHISASLFAPGTSIAAAIANEFTEAVGDLYLSSLVAAGLVLFVVSSIVLAAAQLMLYTLERRAGGRQ